MHVDGEPKFVILGSGRSGSQFISMALRACGVNCGHEEWWGDRRVPGLDGDSSHVATFHSDDFTGVKLAQVRDPMTAIPSMAINGFDHRVSSEHFQVIPRNDTMNAIRWWTISTRKAVESAEWWWKARDVDENTLVEIGERTGFPIDRDVARHAIEIVPRNANHRKRIHSLFRWPDCPETIEAFKLGKSLGYDVPER